MTPDERLAAAAWAATQEIAGSSAHRARLDEAVAAMPGINRIEGYVAPDWLRLDDAPASTWNELKQAWRGQTTRIDPMSPAAWERLLSEPTAAELGMTGHVPYAEYKARLDEWHAQQRGTEMPTTVAPWGASADRRAAETVILTGAKFQGPDLPVAAALASHRRSVLAAEADPFFGGTAGAPDWGGERPLAEQCATLPERQVNAYLPDDYARMDALPERPATGSDVFFTRQIDAHAELRSLRSQNERLRAELRTMRAVINAALGE